MSVGSRRRRCEGEDGGRRTGLPWYGDGLRFECTRCGRCCSGPEQGNVWVTEEEIDRMAAHLGLEREEFFRLHVREVGEGWSLREKEENLDCVLYDPARGCTVYEVRPAQCRAFPFWNANLGSAQRWREVAGTCPGIGQGHRFSVAEIEEVRSRSPV